MNFFRKSPQVVPIPSNLQEKIDSKFQTLTQDLSSLKLEIEKLTSQQSETITIVTGNATTLNQLTLGTLSVKDNSKAIVPTLPTLTSSNVRKHALEIEGRSRLTSYERDEVFFDAADSLPSAREKDDVKQTQKVRDMLYSQFTAGNALFVCERLNEVAGEIPIVGSVINLLTNIFEKVEIAETNKELCENLGLRVFELSVSVKDLLEQSKDISALAPSLLKLKHKLTNASKFIAKFSTRGWLSNLFKGSGDTAAFEAFDDALSHIVSDAQLAVLGKIMIQQGKMNQKADSIGEDVKTVIAQLGGLAQLGKDVQNAKTVADKLGVSVEEIQSEACAEATQKIERHVTTKLGKTMMSAKLIRHRGLRVFWQCQLPNKNKVKNSEFAAALRAHLVDDLQLDTVLADSLLEPHKWDKILQILDQDEDGFVTISELRKVFNIIRKKNKKDEDIVSALRSLVKRSEKKKNAKAHLKVDTYVAGNKKKAYFGRTAEIAILKKSLLSEDQNDFFHAVEVCGADGVGKTAFANKVCDLVGVQNHFNAGINYISLENFGSEVQRCVGTSEDLAMAVLQSLNKDLLDTDEDTFDAREFLFEYIVEGTCSNSDGIISPKAKYDQGRRMLFIFDGIDPDSPDEIFSEISTLASLPFVSAILLTTEPVRHPKLQISTRVTLDPLDLQEAAKLVHHANPLLSRKQRKAVMVMGKGNPETLVTLANMSNAELREVEKAKAKRQTIEGDWTSSSQFSASPKRGGLEYKDENSRFSIESVGSGDTGGPVTEEEMNELNILTLLRGASEGESSTQSTPARPVTSVSDIANVKIAAMKLGFAVDLPGPSTLRRAKTDPSGKKKNKAIRSRPGSVKAHDMQELTPKSTTSEAGSAFDGDLDEEETNPPPLEVVGPPKVLKKRASWRAMADRGSVNSHANPGRRQSIFDIFQPENDVTQTVIHSLSIEQKSLLQMVSIVPSSFDLDFIEYCWEHRAKVDPSLENDEECIFDSAKEVFASFFEKGFIDVAGYDCERFFVKKNWKRTTLRGLVLHPEVLNRVQENYTIYYLNLIVVLGEDYNSAGEGQSWVKDESLIKFEDDRDNIVSVLKDGSESARKAFETSSAIIKRGVKKSVLLSIKETHLPD
ncbi:hypothetical protein TL16_g12791 [Triparma laevis f. inornata]|uniref:EF-hand domain-containing protein n=1 Tax=Triparma laevis f. inornata TaxID=1714386 RepID=A0A9W7BX71_9STRA|nr:hypothetical protein TL16_g12791 [Triparma laevis f. inornata]